jgi:hypothetical protein
MKKAAALLVGMSNIAAAHAAQSKTSVTVVCDIDTFTMYPKVLDQKAVLLGKMAGTPYAEPLSCAKNAKIKLACDPDIFTINYSNKTINLTTEIYDHSPLTVKIWNDHYIIADESGDDGETTSGLHFHAYTSYRLNRITGHIQVIDGYRTNAGQDLTDAQRAQIKSDFLGPSGGVDVRDGHCAKERKKF